MNGKMKLSQHFTLGELTKSSHAEVYNIPSHQAIENLKRVCEWLEELRARAGVPIIINSGYRSPQLNKIVGGAKGSNHLNGYAVDIRVSGIEQAIRYAAILLDIADSRKDLSISRVCSRGDFDEILIETNRYGAMWLHFAVRPPSQENRRKVAFLRA